ncbi:MAG: cell division protein FtsW [Deltaproteobacteria bacterium RBG_13_47_9]|nr:MAG: cell division protein FtsW [Deltaproteobacteria bacterium RBG_13_47_9]
MKGKRKFDIVLLFVVLALVGIGVVMVYSTSAIIAGDRFGDPYYFLKRQAFHAGIGFVLMILMMFFPYGVLKRFAYPILILSILILIAVLIPGIGHRAGGSMRWLKIQAFSFQPSEFAKLGLIIFLAYFMTKKEERIRSFSFGFLPTILFSGIVIALVMKEPDFGAALFLTVMVLLLLFVSGARVIYILGALLLAAPVVYYLLMNVGYRYKRLISFIRPWEDPTGNSFQIIQSFLSFGSGGLFGLGLGEGRQKLFFLPAPHTDFIFSVIGEELGLIGAMIVILLFFILMLRGIHIGLSLEDRFGAYLALGITLMISLQAVINMGVVLGLLPTKGLTLPLVSYGGTSLVANLIGVGILLRLSTHMERR